ncbi:hypothetical protein SLS60_002133 [Paraconiothyrium brasiliense]|uniref:Ubiquitin-like domain-containing protein n=1 Tax=Paraconiothyrium brasiliense TaxID=300254 RepID=A0ABR3S1B5_9PLEO
MTPPPPPPPLADGNGDTTGPPSKPSIPKTTSNDTPSKPAIFFADGDGQSINTSAWSESYRNNQGTDKHGVIVDRIGESPRWVRETFENAQEYYSYTSYQYYNGVTGERLSTAQVQASSAEVRVPLAANPSITGEAYERQDAEVNTARQELQREAETGENMVPDLVSVNGRFEQRLLEIFVILCLKITKPVVVVGISPTDIVKSVKVLKDAATALTSGPEGARQQFQDAHAALSSLESAAADLTLMRSASSKNPPDAIYNDLLERERRFQASLQPYDRRLGLNNGTKPWLAIKRKLQYAFDGASKVQRHIIASKPGVDAAIFRTMGTQSDLATRNHEQTVQTVCDGIAQVTERIDAIAPDMIDRLSQAIMSLPQEHSDTVKAALRSHWECTKLDLSRLINQAVQAGIAHSANTEADVSTARIKGKNDGQIKAREPQPASNDRSIRQAPVVIKRETSVAQQTHDRSSTPSISRQTQDVAAQIFQQHTTSVTSKLLLFLLSMSTAALYQSPTTRKALASCLPAYHRDPVSSTLLLLTVLAFANCFIPVPLHVSLLSDNSIFLDTALGEPLKVPRHYWESFDIFHGFLTTHFATRPGQVLVKARRYRILMGGATGQVLDVAKWRVVVSARMKLVMALLIEDSSSDAGCNNFYQSLDTGRDQGAIDGDDLDHPDDIFLRPMDSSSDAVFVGPAKQPIQHMSAKGLSSRLKLEAHPEELQHFVHMLLLRGTEATFPASLSPSSTGSESATSHSATEYLSLLAEALSIRVNNWHGLEFERFGSLQLYGHLTVGKPEQRTQELHCYLFEEILILTKDKRGPEPPTVKVRDQEVKKCTLKGSVLFKKHLTDFSEPQDLVLTLNLCVAELPAINLYFPDSTELETWRRTLSNLAFKDKD